MRGIRIKVIPACATIVAVAATTMACAAASAAARPYTIWSVAGSSAQCTTPPACGDGHAAGGAQLSLPQAVVLAPAGAFYFADSGDNTVRRVGPAGTISLVAGDGTTCQRPPACGDTQQATHAELTFPSGLAVDRAGNLYIADTGDNEIRKVTPQGKITRVAGTGRRCAKPPKCGDGGPGTSAQLTGPTGLAIGRSGVLYIADTGDHEIRKLSTSGRITRVAGTGHRCAKPPACGDVGPPTKAALSFPQAVAVGPGGVLYIADEADQEIRQISGGTITTLAGNGTICTKAPACGDGGAADSALLNYPDGVAVTPSGRVFIADTGDNEIRAVSGGKISRVAGTGAPCKKLPGCGDSHLATTATLNYPNGIAVDRAGNVYVADAYDNMVRWMSTVRPSHIAAGFGSVALAAFSPAVSSRTVGVRYVLGHRAQVTLTVRFQNRSTTVASGRAFEGFGDIFWNRQLGGRPARSGRYKLIVRATIGDHSATSSVQVRF
jgi:sugar lactone lactonase YvrE